MPNKSNDVMDELAAVMERLTSQNVNEDKDEDVTDDVSWVLDDFIANQEEGSQILCAVAGQKESDSCCFDGIS